MASCFHQVQFYDTLQDIVNAVLTRTADAGLLPSGALEELFVQGEITLNSIHVLSQRLVMRHGVRYPYLTSTTLYPNWALVALPTTSAMDRDSFRDWLIPAFDAQADDSLHFVAPLSYAAVGTVLVSHTRFRRALRPLKDDGKPEEASTGQAMLSHCSVLSALLLLVQQLFGVIEPDPSLPGLGRCARPQDEYDAIVCPADHYKLPRYAVAGTCAVATTRTCPANAVCVCQPCKKTAEVQVSLLACHEHEGRGKRKQGHFYRQKG